MKVKNVGDPLIWLKFYYISSIVNVHMHVIIYSYHLGLFNPSFIFLLFIYVIYLFIMDYLTNHLGLQFQPFLNYNKIAKFQKLNLENQSQVHQQFILCILIILQACNS